MRAITAAGLTGLALITLSACHRQGEASSAAPASNAPIVSAAPVVPPPPAAAPERPHRQPGLWEQHVSVDGLEGVQTTQLCVDKVSDEKLSLFSARAADNHCTTNQMLRKTDGTWAFSSVCNLGSGGKVTSAGVITGDVSRAYTVQVDTTTEGAGTPQENGSHHVNITAAWQGPCRPGQKGGDLILPGGMKINILAGMKG
jgi:hypothetical protein